jgi:hypothetical protein
MKLVFLAFVVGGVTYLVKHFLGQRYWIPIRPNANTRVETLPGDPNLGDILVFVCSECSYPRIQCHCGGSFCCCNSDMHIGCRMATRL